MDDMLSTGEVARACSVSADTIRHYEASGAIAPATRQANGYRRYARSVLHEVQVVRRAIAIGFTIDEIGRLRRERASGRPPCRKVRDMAAEKLAALDQRIVEMIALRDDLAAVLGEWEQRLEASNGQPAHLLDALGERTQR